MNCFYVSFIYQNDNIMKKIKYIIIIGITTILSILLWSTCNAGFSIRTYEDSGFYYDYNHNWQNIDDPNTNIDIMIRDEAITNDNNAFQQFLEIFQLRHKDWYTQNWPDKAIYYIKWIINMLLSLTAFVSLVLVIFAFYLVFFSKEDTGLTKAKQILKWVALALAVMWLSWFIVSLFFWIERWTTAEQNWSSIITSQATNQTPMVAAPESSFPYK